MGAGVYTSNFKETGVTFMLSPDFYLTDEEYDNYVKAVEGEVDTPMDRDTWASQELDDYCDQASYVILSACEKLSENTKMGRPWRDRFDADTAFGAICRSTDFVVGMRTWETDYVIGIVPPESIRNLLINGEEYEGQSLRETGQEIADLRTSTGSMIEIVKETVIQALLEGGYDCRYRTSGYTTAAFQKTDGYDIEQKKAEYAATFGSSKAPLFR